MVNGTAMNCSSKNLPAFYLLECHLLYWFSKTNGLLVVSVLICAGFLRNWRTMSDNWQHIVTQATRLRRKLHRLPEIAWQETSTAETIRNTLNQLDIPWRECAKTGTVAQLNPQGKRGPHIALRGDIDALPIHEATSLTWKSQREGCMHACGHDGHTATLMAAASWLKRHESVLPGPVSLLFQPAEEGGHGAREMIDDGALDGVDSIFGWHNWPAIPFGKLLCPPDIVMCGNGTFSITINGLGGHASQPEVCRDPVLAGSAIVLALQQIVSRRLPPQQSAVVSVTSFDGPSGATVIPQTATLGGSIRVPNRNTGQLVNNLIREISEQTASSYGVECSVEIKDRYQATINHAAPAKCVRDAWTQIFGAEAIASDVATPIMASEDFSYYLQQVPGAFALIGSDDGDYCHQVPCHSPHYDFNDALISRVCGLFVHLAGAPQPSGNALTTTSEEVINDDI